MRTYAIIGATGHIGRRVAEALLERGGKVRVIGRNHEKLVPLVNKGAKPFVGTIAEREFLTKAFQGSDAVFTMIPPDVQANSVRSTQTWIGVSIAEAIKEAGVKWVVNLSSQGAHLPEGTGPIAGLHEQEERLNGLPDVNLVHLRPSFFMENMESTIPLIHAQGITGTPIQRDLKMPVIATCDIARVATEYLSELRFTGKTICDLLGHRDLTMVEMTAILAKAISKPGLMYVQFSYEAAKQAMLDMGFSADAASVFIEMYKAFNEGRLMKDLVRTTENTTETSFEDYAVDFARIFTNQTANLKKDESSEKNAEPPTKEQPKWSWWNQLRLWKKAA